jgi:hypothetical protein
MAMPIILHGGGLTSPAPTPPPQHRRLAERRAALDQWAEFVQSLAEGKVVPIDKGAAALFEATPRRPPGRARPVLAACHLTTLETASPIAVGLLPGAKWG